MVHGAGPWAGGASGASPAPFHVLEPKGTKWHWYCWFGIAGNYLLMMFYTVIAGWLLLYCLKMAKGGLCGPWTPTEWPDSSAS